MKNLKIFLTILLTIHLTACGTLLYPERKGQPHAGIDPAVMVLDGIGLLFFILPGVIAFTIDISNGTIYLPADEAAMKNSEYFRIVHYKKNNIHTNQLEALISNETSSPFSFSDPHLNVQSIDKKEDVAGIMKGYQFISQQQIASLQ